MDGSGFSRASADAILDSAGATRVEQRNAPVTMAASLSGSSELCDGDIVSSSERRGCVRLFLLRDFELRLDETVIDVPPTSQRLIVFLALHGQRQVRRSYVSGSLWLDSSDARANASLRSAIWRSPSIGGKPLVGASNSHVWLRPDLEVDLKWASHRAQWVLALPSLDRAEIDVIAELKAFSDDVLVGWYDEWVLSERERFRQLRLHVLEQLGELLLRAHRYSEAVQFGLAAVSSEPLRDSAHRLLVRAHLCEGNLSEALRQYRAYADSLARELRVRPSQAMERLIAEALDGAGGASWRRTETGGNRYRSPAGA
jgi:DNA-binding SARP family transcriptional activator